MDSQQPGWEGVQRHGQVIGDCFNSLAHGLGCMLQSHTRSSPGDSSEASLDPRLSSQWPWLWPTTQTRRSSSTVRLRQEIRKRSHSAERKVGDAETSAIQDFGNRVGRVGAEVGAYVAEFVGNVKQHFPQPFNIFGDATQSGTSSYFEDGESERMENCGCGDGGPITSENCSRRSPGRSAASRKSRISGCGCTTSDGKSTQQNAQEFHDLSTDELFTIISKSNGQLHKQSSVTVTTTYDSRTQDIESSVVAKGDLWRAEASHGGSSSEGVASPLLLLQVGPILFVRDTTLLIPVHLSKQHLLWYGFDRKNGLHSLCPALWSKHRRWLLMSMICINPLTCSFVDLQFPNGQVTYMAGEGVTGHAFMSAFGGLLQAHGQFPGDSKLSFSYKNKWGTRLCPLVQLPEKSISLELMQPLAWQRSGLMLQPTVQLSVTPTLGGRNPGWRAEVTHSPQEKLSWGWGCAMTMEPSAFATIALGRSKRNGEHTGSSGLVLQVQAPLENVSRASFSVQLNSGVEF